jgi:hypothetical protein
VAKSELAKNLQELIEGLDKLAQDMISNTNEIITAAKKVIKDLPEQNKGGEDEKKEGV